MNMYDIFMCKRSVFINNNSVLYIYTSELPVKIFTDSGKFTNVHAKNIHWCMQGPYIGLYSPITVKTSVSSQS